jgi:molybdenum cofactor biosynthesis enzyme MoaA
MNFLKNIFAKHKRLNIFNRKKYICNAPFTNMYFNIHGDAAPCWLGFINPDSYPDKSIQEIWTGNRFEEFRKNIKNNNLEITCSTCLQNLKSGNQISMLARAYDHLNKHSKYPLMMELELDNTCNLECIMCHGFLSSSIRKNREQKEPINIPYDDKFIEQLNEFIPHLQELRINGGEPFLSEICYKIFNNVIKLNPKLKLVVATNGTVWNSKIENWLEKGNFNINLSLDSLQKENYESIRLNADFDKTMQNFYRFINYCKTKGTKLCILINPMRQNWWEMPDFVKFCNKHNIPLWFNTIQYPKDCSLWALQTEKLSVVYETLAEVSIKPVATAPESYHNCRVYSNLVHKQIKQWLSESQANNMKDKKPEKPEYDVFLAHIINIIDKKEYKDTQRNELINDISNKLDKLIKHAEKNNISRTDFFRVVNNAPIELVYEEIVSNDIEQLIVMIEKYSDK